MRPLPQTTKLAARLVVLALAIALGSLLLFGRGAEANPTFVQPTGSLTWKVSQHAWTSSSLAPSHAAGAPATKDPVNGFVFPVTDEWYDPATGESDLQFAGSLTLGNVVQGGYRIMLADPRVTIDATGAGTVIADLTYCVSTADCLNPWIGPATVTVTTFQTAPAGITDTGSNVSWTFTPFYTSVGNSFHSNFINTLPASLRAHFRNSGSPSDPNKPPAPVSVTFDYSPPPADGLTWKVSEHAWTSSSLAPNHLATPPAVKDPANGWVFPAAIVGYNPATGETSIDFDGALTLGNTVQGGYRITLGNPAIEIDALGNGRLLAEVTYRVSAASPFIGPSPRVTIVTFNMSAADVIDTGDEITLKVTPNYASVGNSFDAEFINTLPSSLRAHFRNSGSSSDPNKPAAPITLNFDYDACTNCTDLETAAVATTCDSGAITNTPFNCIANVTVHNNGPTDNVPSVVSATLTPPFDCTLTPAMTQDVSSPVLATSVSTVVPVTWSATCTSQSFHLFMAQASISPDFGYIDTDASNDAGTGQASPPVTALTDVKVQSVAVTAPPSSAPATSFAVTVNLVLHNNGPVTPLDGEGGVGIALPADCTATPAGPQLFNPVALPVSTNVPVSKAWNVSCTSEGVHEFIACGRVGPLTLHVSDPVTSNNFGSATFSVAIGASPATVHTGVSCSLPGDPPEVCDNGVDDDGDGAIDEEPDTDRDGVSNCLDADDDNDNFSDAAEAFIGTSALSPCPDNPFDAAWPPDFDNSRSINISDVLRIKPVFNSAPGSAAYAQRWDLTANGTVNISDVLALKPYFGGSCN